jgi:SAM-dependent methyltransferase
MDERMAEVKQHWEQVYQTKPPTEVSWYRPHLDVSLQLIDGAGVPLDAPIIDVGAGESTLVDDLIARGYRRLSVLDISAIALDVTKARLGTDAERVSWLLGDVRTFPFGPAQYDIWHDRAVFHFLTDAADRAAYVRQVMRALRPGGHVIVATFGPEGPTTCSGFDVVRYEPGGLSSEFGAAFRLVQHHTELHRTPNGATLQFTYCYCRVADVS